MPRYFDPDGNALGLMEWAKLFEARDNDDTSWWRRETLFVDTRVSTVWLGLDHQFFDGPPLFWETMIFGGDHDQYQCRYSSRDAAFAGHDRIVAALRAGEGPDV